MTPNEASLTLRLTYHRKKQEDLIKEITHSWGLALLTKRECREWIRVILALRGGEGIDF